ncbi:hypothetical protein KXD40_009377 [Peronospora effusa]|uniref:Uncharacterized protein n=1 Tax=Peronospora effusa TaxID=542832 RepID=A0A3M6VR51_9STRA|nr:hypothetical protein DD238_004068 [Peronospora effusa]RQM16143.1 hypothetical protein DD237_004579 [Peronospora effusa]UIZ28456.1 hypothetical protein KXD40_009377 [Peronospora effusa]
MVAWSVDVAGVWVEVRRGLQVCRVGVVMVLIVVVVKEDIGVVYLVVQTNTHTWRSMNDFEAGIVEQDMLVMSCSTMPAQKYMSATCYRIGLGSPLILEPHLDLDFCFWYGEDRNRHLSEEADAVLGDFRQRCLRKIWGGRGMQGQQQEVFGGGGAVTFVGLPDIGEAEKEAGRDKNGQDKRSSCEDELAALLYKGHGVEYKQTRG